MIEENLKVCSVCGGTKFFVERVFNVKEKKVKFALHCCTCESLKQEKIKRITVGGDLA